MTDQWVNELFKSKKQKRYEARIAKIEAMRVARQQQQTEKARQLQQQQQTEKARIAKEKTEAFACRRYPEKFANNTKLHEHVRTKHAKKPSITTPSTPPASSPSTPITSHATIPTTPRIPISWAEIASRPKSSAATPSRLPRPTALPTPPPSPHLPPILLHQKPANSITKRPSITRFIQTPYLTVEDLYNRFHDKPRPSSLTTIQNSLPPASTTGQHMRSHQMRITSYFKPATNDPTPRPPTSANSVTKLASNRKHADSKSHDKSVRINDLTSSNSYDSHSTNKPHHTYRRCTQHFTSENMLHRHLSHCSKDTNRWLPARTLTEERHPSRSFISRY